MTFTKPEMLQMLEQIKTEFNVNINKYIDDVITHDIPSESLKFINLYIPLKDLGKPYCKKTMKHLQGGWK